MRILATLSAPPAHQSGAPVGHALASRSSSLSRLTLLLLTDMDCATVCRHHIVKCCSGTNGTALHNSLRCKLGQKSARHHHRRGRRLPAAEARIAGAHCARSQVFFDRQRLELVRLVEMGPSVSALLWHERLNQIFVGTGAAALDASMLPQPA